MARPSLFVVAIVSLLAITVLVNLAVYSNTLAAFYCSQDPAASHTFFRKAAVEPPPEVTGGGGGASGGASGGAGGGGTTPPSPVPASPGRPWAKDTTIINEDPSYLPPMKQPPNSPALARALRRYVNVHNAITGKNPVEPEFAEELKNIPKKWVTVSPIGQLANRVLPVLSGFLLALMTDRAVTAGFDYYAGWFDLWESPGFDITGGGAGGSSFGFSLASEGGFEASEQLLCGNLTTDFEKYDTISVSSNQYWGAYLRLNPRYAAWFDELFPDGDYFGPLVRFLFRPSEYVRNAMADFKKEHNWDGRYVVGMQARSGPDFTDKKFLAPDWKMLGECALQLVPPEKRKDALFFVATDIGWARDDGYKVLSPMAETVFFGKDFLLSNHPKGCQHAVADVLLMAAANDLITTPWSTFGYLAAGYANHRPVLLTEIQKNEASLPPPEEDPRYMGIKMHSDIRTGCVRSSTSEPCFHYFRFYGFDKVSCYNKEWGMNVFRRGRYC